LSTSSLSTWSRKMMVPSRGMISASQFLRDSAAAAM
jgi:hypothetical protein